MTTPAQLSVRDLFAPEILDKRDGWVEIRFSVKPEFTIPSGVVQGGIVGAMLDMAMAIAGDGMISTASLHLDLVQPVKGPSLTVVGSIVRRGRRIVFAEAEMKNEAGDVVARGRQTAVPLS